MAEEFDPFEGGGVPDDDPIDLPPEMPPTETKPKRTTRKTTTKKESPVSDETTSDRSGLTLTFKGGAGFDAPWIVLHARTLEEADAFLSPDNKELLESVMSRTQQAGAYFVSKAPEKAAGASNGGARGGSTGQARGAAPAGAQEHPEGKKEFCEHGPMKFMSGVSRKTGKPYSMFVCQSGDRNNECKPKNA